MSEKPKRRPIYQKELIDLGDVQVTVKSNVVATNIVGKSDYIFLEIDGEDRLYPLDSPQCRDFFRAAEKGRSMIIRASGFRDKSALQWIKDVESTNGHHAAPPQQQQRQPEPSVHPPPQTSGLPPRPAQEPVNERQAANQPVSPLLKEEPVRSLPPPRPEKSPEEKLADARIRAAQVRNLWALSYAEAEVARNVISVQLKKEMTDGQFQAAVASIFIKLKDDGMVDRMPLGDVDLKPHAGQ